ncbi:DUF177 domain-containing protein [Phreatobacter stygius]|uniref:DUF177 domain-containing protein n=1 Tax=Phreatobacter stygius TaxID=1940610 RepID=A0A4D7BEA0_9HYPH|nr:DUF177 domain-containing protein [Phreatobacter stygius]QCI68885.1 DUF177 domain-containing protein [Phreatobacter stygius]
MTSDQSAGHMPRWPVRIHDVPAGGRHYKRDRLEPADSAALAAAIGVNAITAFLLDVDVTPYRGDGLAASGRVKATVVQTCVVSLEPVENVIEEEVDATFRPVDKLKPHLVHDEEDGLAIDASVAADDPLVGGEIDLAALAVEFLALVVDPYPRRPDAAFEAPAAGEGASPFAGLVKLKREP